MQFDSIIDFQVIIRGVYATNDEHFSQQLRHCSMISFDFLRSIVKMDPHTIITMPAEPAPASPHQSIMTEEALLSSPIMKPFYLLCYRALVGLFLFASMLLYICCYQASIPTTHHIFHTVSP